MIILSEDMIDHRSYAHNLRATDSKYGESNDSSEISDFLLLRKKDPFGELFSEIYLTSSYFLVK